MSIGIGQEPVGLRRPVLISGSSGLVSIVLNGSTPLAYCDAMPNYDDANKSVRRQLTGYNVDGSVMAHASLEERGIYILGREGGEQNKGNMTLWTPSGKVAIGRFASAYSIPSGLHAALFSFDRGVAIADLGSLGGTFVMGMGDSGVFSVHFPGRDSADKPVHSAHTVTEHVPHSSFMAYKNSIVAP
ncbi:hypothetical protein HYU12_02510 [Candidatus Woesearchaeota archaeon]|nr:hypothetical protein [Candidatus Woesearchaeota archaeon]